MQSMYKGLLRGFTPLLFNWVATLKQVSYLNFDIFPLFQNERLNWHNSILFANLAVPYFYRTCAGLYLPFSLNQPKSNQNFLLVSSNALVVGRWSKGKWKSNGFIIYQKFSWNHHGCNTFAIITFFISYICYKYICCDLHKLDEFRPYAGLGTLKHWSGSGGAGLSLQPNYHFLQLWLM